jgi:lysophospholipase L1-like esterase
MNEPRSSRRPRAATILLVINVAALSAVGVEIGARLFVYGFEHWRSDYRAKADGYADSDWSEAYYRELARASSTTWQPYVYWRRPPYAGRFINVDDHGLRRSWQSSSPDAARRRVLVMGGSTVWGTGARDEYTLPSELAKALDHAGRPAMVMNYGESGYVSGQSLAALIVALRAGERPTHVIFYGGIEDTFAAYQNGAAGIPQNENNRRLEFNLTQPTAIDKLGALLVAGTTRASALILQRPEGQRTAEESVDPGRLAAAVVDAYCANARLAAALGREFGFRVSAFWQPVIFSKPSLTPYELAEAARRQSTRQLFAATRALVTGNTAGCAGVGLVDLSAVFASDAGPRFLDAMHLTETGNQEVAIAMTPQLLRAMAQ